MEDESLTLISRSDVEMSLLQKFQHERDILQNKHS